MFALYAANGSFSIAVAAPLSSFEAPSSAVNNTYTAAIENAPLLEQHRIVVNANTHPHIALLLPLDDKNFASAALAVRDGFLSAASLNPLNLPIQIYSNYDESSNVLDTYRQAIANGAQAVVGPLTRKGVSALAAEQDIPVPTLALNAVDANPAEQFYFFNMALDAEARTIAELAAQQNFHQAIVISTHSSLSQRMQFSFEEAWHQLGGNIVREIEFNDDASVLTGLRAAPDTLVFLAADAQQAHQIRPFLPNKLPTYATSQIFNGNEDTLTNYDLSGIRFVDMPWLLQPDQSSVLLYPHSVAPLSTDRERLYAFGIDAYRLVQLMLAHGLATNLPLEGVTGQIQLKQHTLQRTAIAGIFSQGRAQSITAATAPAIQMFPGQAKQKP